MCRFLLSGDAALIVELGESVDRATNARVLQLHHALVACPPKGVIETVPAFRSLLVQYDPLRISLAELQSAITSLLEHPGGATLPSRQWDIPVCYDPKLALDMAAVSEATGLSPSTIAEIHASAIYYVYMVGFLPGFGYLGDLPPALQLPRRTHPRARVPQGAIAIATGFTAIYPLESPGGWHVIGQTPLSVFEMGGEKITGFVPGDTVRFHPISLEAFSLLASQSVSKSASGIKAI